MTPQSKISVVFTPLPRHTVVVRGKGQEARDQNKKQGARGERQEGERQEHEARPANIFKERQQTRGKKFSSFGCYGVLVRTVGNVEM